jgi:predicted N-acetyltransferase YhbS
MQLLVVLGRNRHINNVTFVLLHEATFYMATVFSTDSGHHIYKRTNVQDDFSR